MIANVLVMPRLTMTDVHAIVSHTPAPSYAALAAQNTGKIGAWTAERKRTAKPVGMPGRTLCSALSRLRQSRMCACAGRG